MKLDKEVEQNHEILSRILVAVEKDSHTRWVEIVCTVFLSLATILSGWCVYQSAQWNGEFFYRMEDFNQADRQRAELEVQALQKMAFDASLFLTYLQSKNVGNGQWADFLDDRFAPHLKTAIIAWEATNPLSNRDAPKSPFTMSEYKLPETEKAARFGAEGRAARDEAVVADNHSDSYLLLSLLLNAVLFFSGLAGVIESYLHQRILIGIAAILLVISAVFLLRMPTII